MQYALFSLSNKDGAVELARFLQQQGLSLLATGSTAAFLGRAGLAVERVSEFTGSPEMLDGRVKTLHPRLHGSLLYRRSEHQAEAQRSELRDIAVVACNLYPFAQVAASSDEIAEIVENIDIGGPAMLRSAAKNYQSVSVLCQPEDYPGFIAEWQQGGISLRSRSLLAAKAYSHTAYYDALISAWFHRHNGELFPEKLVLAAERQQLVRYGENPHQAGAIYRSPAAGAGLLTRCCQLHGKEMSYNNFLDAEAALGFLRLFGQPAVVIVKHQNPCGSAIAQGQAEGLASIYQRALACDAVSAFGGIVACNGEVELELAEQIAQTFYEIVLAPRYTSKALLRLRAKKNLRILEVPAETPGLRLPELEWRPLSGGFAVQQPDHSLQAEPGQHEDRERKTFCCVSAQQPTEQDWEELLFAWKIASRVKSNAIVLAKDLSAPGIGAGQMSRIDSVRLAAQKMIAAGCDSKGSYLASDAFFPFRDAVDLAAEYGVRAIIQPGGSVRDAEVIRAADEGGMIMVCTGVRHFYH